MKKIFYTAILLLAVACQSGESTGNSSNGDTNASKGNSPGSNIIEMDTVHIDTSGNANSTY